MKRVLLGVFGLIVALLAIMAIRAAMLESKQPSAGERASIDVDIDAVASRFSAALTYPTISHRRVEDRQPEVFLEFHDFLEASFPAVHHTLTRETINELSLLYRWEGREPNLPPVLLMGHMDVVPVIPGTEEDWQHPPFGGIVADGQIWGRGALDDKSSLMAILEAVEQLAAAGFQPRRTIYLAFGHDEEVGGPEGARRIAETLFQRGIDPFAMILDEGGFIGEGLSSSLDGKVAVIGIAEKGFVSLELIVESDGGHSSTPPDHTALGILSKAVTKLEENQFPARLEGTTESMLDYIAPEMPFLAKMVMANLWLTRPLVTRLMLADSSSAAMVRTTTAVTIMNGGVKENVLPIEARAVVNHRIIPGETVESVTQRVREVIDDERVAVSPLGWTGEPSPVSDPTSPAFELLGRTLLEVAPDEEITVTPYLVIGGTDAKYYSGRSDSVFRFLPVSSGSDVMEMVHGTNERISLASLELAVRYFVQLIRNTDDLARGES